VLPRRLLEAGFPFRHSTVLAALGAVYGRRVSV